jgi:hypothetical protein
VASQKRHEKAKSCQDHQRYIAKIRIQLQGRSQIKVGRKGEKNGEHHQKDPLKHQKNYGKGHIGTFAFLDEDIGRITASKKEFSFSFQKKQHFSYL